MKNAPLPVLINRNGGTAARKGAAITDELRRAFSAVDVGIELRLIDGRQMAEAIAAVADRPVIAVGGGDGTIGCAAGALFAAKSKARLALLALGTRNHLALQLGIPPDLTEAAAVIAAGRTRRIDLGCVNDHIFINNASIGLYPEMVREREAEQERGLPKWLARAPASWRVLKRIRHHRLRLRLPGEAQAIRTPLLFVGNNRYELERGRVGQRAALDDGRLSLYALGATSRLGLMRVAAKTLIGRADREQDFAAISEAERFAVEVHARTLDVALDGEVVRLDSPLHFASLPGALGVIAPAA